MNALSAANLVLAALFAAGCVYQVVYIFLRLAGKRRTFRARKLCRYAVLVAARNEEAVIGQLLDSIRAQDYPAELVSVFVAADNCTDSTARVAAEHGAAVFERQDRIRMGKGYALSFLLEKIDETCGPGSFDGYFVFDADNLLDPRYISEMNKVFSSGERVVTGYRNSKNFGDNWITAGYGLYFLRESEHMNRPRDYLGSSCFVSGTGFLFADSLLRELGGWNYHLLTEDLEFTADLIARGERVAYCGDAVFYDEQPRGLKQSVIQRSRWIRGCFQVIGRHGSGLARALAGGSFAGFDMFMCTAAVALFSFLSFFLNSAVFLLAFFTAPGQLPGLLLSSLPALALAYAAAYLMGAAVLFTERRRICCSVWKKLLYSFTFPIFLLTFTAALAGALFGGSQWKPIPHTAALSIGDMKLRR